MPGGGGWRAALVIAIVAVPLAGCAAHAPGSRFILRHGSGPIELRNGPWPAAKPLSASALRDAEAAARATRTAAPTVATVESSTPELRDALEALRHAATAASHLRVADAYRRARVLDSALDHYDAALKTDRRLAAAYDGRARIWRDWGLLGPGVSDAARAVYFAPTSPSARNTLGTLLMALGDCAGARDAFLEARRLDATATYAERNLDTVNRALVEGGAPCGPPRRAVTIAHR